MDAIITPQKLNGSVRAIASKSDAHRLLICAALANAETSVHGICWSDDVKTTARCISAMGAHIAINGDAAVITPAKGAIPDGAVFDCGECAATLRFMLPVIAARLNGKRAVFAGGAALAKRPLRPLIDCLGNGGVSFSRQSLPFIISGGLKPGAFELPGDVSSQFVSGLFLALPGLAGPSRARLTTRLESSGYARMTVLTLRRFGVGIDFDGDTAHIAGHGKLLSPGVCGVEGDWSNAAVFLAAGALGSGVTVTGLDMASPQGDREIVTILRRMGARLSIRNGCVTAQPGPLYAIDADCKDTPDLAPVIAVLASAANGVSRITGASRLRYKESDRLTAVCDMLTALGGRARQTHDGFEITGGYLSGGITDSHGDHRIAMAAAIAAQICDKAVVIKNAQAISKSYPDFFADYNSLGGGAQCHP